MTSTVRPARGHPGKAPQRELPLEIFGIALGLTGLGGAWAAASQLLNAPHWPEEVLYAIGAVSWISFTGVYLAQSIRRSGKLRADMEHPVSGPFIAFIPIVALLLAQHYAQYAPTVGRAAVVVFVALLALIAARLTAHWMSGEPQGAAILHGGYFLPVVAGPFIASIGLISVGLREPGVYAFGAGLFFWFTLGAAVMYAHIAGDRTDSLVPALSAYLASTASAAIAWLLAHPGPGPLDTSQSLLTGVFFIMLLVQLALVGSYRRTASGMQYWVFTFPVASSSNYLIRWLERADIAGWQPWAWAVVAIATVFVVAVGGGTIAPLVLGRARMR